jgi:serine protease inhibitor
VRADFTGLSLKAGELAFVQQAATLQVGEKGTVGAAAAAVGVYPASADYDPVTVWFNRPTVHDDLLSPIGHDPRGGAGRAALLSR